MKTSKFIARQLAWILTCFAFLLSSCTSTKGKKSRTAAKKSPSTMTTPPKQKRDNGRIALVPVPSGKESLSSPWDAEAEPAVAKPVEQVVQDTTPIEDTPSVPADLTPPAGEEVTTTKTTTVVAETDTTTPEKAPEIKVTEKVTIESTGKPTDVPQAKFTEKTPDGLTAKGSVETPATTTPVPTTSETTVTVEEKVDPAKGTATTTTTVESATTTTEPATSIEMPTATLWAYIQPQVHKVGTKNLFHAELYTEHFVAGNAVEIGKLHIRTIGYVGANEVYVGVREKGEIGWLYQAAKMLTPEEARATKTDSVYKDFTSAQIYEFPIVVEIKNGHQKFNIDFLTESGIDGMTVHFQHADDTYEAVVERLNAGTTQCIMFKRSAILKAPELEDKAQILLANAAKFTEKPVETAATTPPGAGNGQTPDVNSPSWFSGIRWFYPLLILALILIGWAVLRREKIAAKVVEFNDWRKRRHANTQKAGSRRLQSLPEQKRGDSPADKAKPAWMKSEEDMPDGIPPAPRNTATRPPSRDTDRLRPPGAVNLSTLRDELQHEKPAPDASVPTSPTIVPVPLQPPPRHQNWIPSPFVPLGPPPQPYQNPPAPPSARRVPETVVAKESAPPEEPSTQGWAPPITKETARITLASQPEETPPPPIEVTQAEEPALPLVPPLVLPSTLVKDGFGSESASHPIKPIQKPTAVAVVGSRAFAKGAWVTPCFGKRKVITGSNMVPGAAFEGAIIGLHVAQKNPVLGCINMCSGQTSTT